MQHALAVLPVPVVMDWCGGASAANLDQAMARLTGSLA